MTEPNSMLSDTGLRRKDKILQSALDAARARRIQRRAAKGFAFTALAAAIFAVVWPRLHMSSPTSIPIAKKYQVPQNSPRSIVISRITDDPSVVSRLAIAEPPNTIQPIGDEQLLDELAKAREPAGLAYVNGKAELIYR